jgi:hypothetical protein
MNRDGFFSVARACRMACAVSVLMSCALPANAVLTNKYTFNDNTADDSIGGQDGLIVDNTGISGFVGGAIDLSANNGANSNQDFSNPATVGAYVDLPNGVFTNAVDTSPTGGEVSLEIWFTTQQNFGWAEVYSFGISLGGENISNEGDSYVALIPQSGVGPPDFRATTRDGGSDLENPVIGSATPLPTGIKQHVVYTLNHFDSDGGANPNGTGRLYLNGAEVGTAEIAGFLDSFSLNDDNNWLGRSQWPDALYDGSIDEFRIYNHALTPTEVSDSFTVGPDPAPLPVLTIDRDTGAVSVANQSGGNIQLKGYSITSAAGALNPSTWTSIDADNTFDPNGTWTAQSTTSTNLAESVTSGTLDGGTLAPASSRGIGTPWLKTPFQDVVFGFTLGDDSTGFGAVQYTGTALARSDLNGDASIDVADWSLFLPHSFTSFPAETAVGAYRKGDLDGDKDNDYADFQLFKSDFNAFNGAGAFEALIGGVPEPTSLALAVLALAIAGVRFRRTT